MPKYRVVTFARVIITYEILAESKDEIWTKFPDINAKEISDDEGDEEIDSIEEIEE